jgi:hypothetical protein
VSATLDGMNNQAFTATIKLELTIEAPDEPTAREMADAVLKGVKTTYSGIEANVAIAQGDIESFGPATYEGDEIDRADAQRRADTESEQTE